MIKFLFISFLFFSCSNSILPKRNKLETFNNFGYLEKSPILEEMQIFCSEENSCLKGECLTRGDGMKVCFHNGLNGNFCRSSLECQNKKCADRGDGLHICMGNGREGDFCQNTEDCTQGACSKLGDIFGFCLTQ